jgi:hypothetical protein
MIMRRLSLVLIGLFGVGMFYLLLFVFSVGILAGSRAVYPPATEPWDRYLLQERDNQPTLRCEYITGFVTVERHYPARREDGTGEALCPRLMIL